MDNTVSEASISMIPKKSGIYKITNSSNNHCYIGQTHNLFDRKTRHITSLNGQYHHNSHLQRAFNKYGEKAFVFNVVLICESSELTYYEQKIVELYNPEYNIHKICVTSPFGIKRTEESKQKTSGVNHWMFGKTMSDEHKKNLSNARKGIYPSEETRKKLSEAKKGKPRSPETIRKMSEAQKGEKGNHYGIPLSEEHKQKLLLANIGRKHKDETILKMSIARKLYWEKKHAN